MHGFVVSSRAASLSRWIWANNGGVENNMTRDHVGLSSQRGVDKTLCVNAILLLITN